MNNIYFILFILISTSVYSQTQYEMNTEAFEAYKKADTKLNTVYKSILNVYKQDTIFLDRLKKSQRIWITFRDAELEMKYPETPKRVFYGSVYPMCSSIYLMELTNKRIEVLNTWLLGIDEGELCIGSVKTKTRLKSQQ